MTDDDIEPLRRARLRFRDARHQLAAAALSGDDRATVAAARHLLRAHDRLRAALDHPSRRDGKTLRRWRRFALAALRSDPPAAGLLDRIRALIPTTTTNNTGTT